MRRQVPSFLTAFMVVCSASAVAWAQPHAKKLIEYGWDVPNPDYVRQNIAEMEKLPFDGLIFRLPKGGNIFTNEEWNEADFAQAFDDCKNIQWQKFTDNFLCTYAASKMDWFNDRDWDAVRHNLRIVAKAAALARCRGICFDAEPYGNNPWSYPTQAHAKEKSFAEYQAKVRQRGAEFVKAIEREMRSPVIHTFFLLSLFGEALNEPDPAKRDQKISQQHYALLPAFLNGMLDAAGPHTVITDGNEPAYYYTNPLPFYQVYHLIRQRALAMVAPENIRKYQTQLEASQALYVDFVFGLGTWAKRSVGGILTPEERAKWFEHNVYYALTTSDEFVWLYSEKMNWWKNVDVPPGLREAVESARTKLANRKPLGFDVTDTLKAAKTRQQAQIEAGLIHRVAQIVRIPAGQQTPVIDGKLDDPVWQATTLLDEFVLYASEKQPKPKAPTKAWVTYDDKNLYIAFQCAEPKKDKMKIVGPERDNPVWEGDSVDVFLSKGDKPAPYVHFILNPNNVQWDAVLENENDTSFDPQWQSATTIGDKEWIAEMAIPWTEIGIPAPASGTKRRANLCRQRIPDREQTSWSQNISGFMEERNFGTWEFK